MRVKNASEERKKKIKNMETSQIDRKKRIREISKTIQETDKEIAATKNLHEATENILKQKDEAVQVVAKRYKMISYEYFAVSSQEDKDEVDENPSRII